MQGIYTILFSFFNYLGQNKTNGYAIIYNTSLTYIKTFNSPCTKTDYKTKIQKIQTSILNIRKYLYTISNSTTYCFIF